MRVRFPSLVDPRVALTVKAEVVVPKSGTEKQTTRYRVGPAIYLSRQAQLKNVESRSKKDSLSIYEMRAKVEPCNLKERRSLSSLPLSLYIENLVIILVSYGVKLCR